MSQSEVARSLIKEFTLCHSKLWNPQIQDIPLRFSFPIIRLLIHLTLTFFLGRYSRAMASSVNTSTVSNLHLLHPIHAIRNIMTPFTSYITILALCDNRYVFKITHQTPILSHSFLGWWFVQVSQSLFTSSLTHSGSDLPS